jgi:uncharacterized protein YdeI (BOF family)
MFDICRSLAVAVLVLGLVSVPLFAQSQPAAQDPASQQTAAGQSQSQAQQVQTFTGKLVKSKGKLVLQDAASGAAYSLDNEDQLKQYEGKNVKITGTLDPSTNMIHVTNVEMASS